MRLWSLHPCCLDAKGLAALWREALLARAVLKGETKGYQHHPQLERFRACGKPVTAINRYLWGIYNESLKRHFHFNAGKLGRKCNEIAIQVTKSQLRYELRHLKRKLQTRDPAIYRKIKAISDPKPHELFEVVEGDIAPWERVKQDVRRVGLKKEPGNTRSTQKII